MDLSRIGRRLKEGRMEQGLSIRELSDISRVAGSTISQIETGKASPNLLTLKSICDALSIPVFSLFLEDDQEKIQLVRHDQQKTFVRNLSDGRPLMESLIIQGKNEMYAATVSVPPHADSGPYAHHGGEEFVYVLTGCVIFELENHGSYTLYANDTLYYPNHIGHRWSNPKEEDAKILMVSTAPYTF